MRRVSSRQRLVSWDAFDASPRNEEDDEASTATGSSVYSHSSGPEASSLSLQRTPPTIKGSSVPPAVTATDGTVASGSSPRPKRKRFSRRVKQEPAATTTHKDSSLEDVSPAAAPVVSAFPWEVMAAEQSRNPLDLALNDLALSSTTTGNEKKHESSFMTLLSDDIQLDVFSFLQVQDVRSLMETSQQLHRLVQSDKASSLWQNLGQQRWPYLLQNDTTREMLMVDTTASSSNNKPNMNRLLQLGARHVATNVDEAKFPRVLLRRRRGHDHVRAFHTLMERVDGGAVRFRGSIGSGDRSFRANQPLPRPTLITTTPNDRDASVSSRRSRRHPASLTTRRHRGGRAVASFQRYFLLRRGGRQPQQQRANPQAPPLCRPFVAPFVVKADEEDSSTSWFRPETTICVAPRLISYYEVSIHKAPEPETRTLSSFSPPAADRPARADCVAVGLALEGFDLDWRMPGWDADSFGYHGDDGGIFHNAGHMVKRFGPTFGAGDTVGCGIDYQQGAIFFTLNGEFLGYAFDSKTMQGISDARGEVDFLWKNDFYPVVGMDTNQLVQCNFGTDRPFLFDLQGLLDEQKEVVLRNLGQCR